MKGKEEIKPTNESAEIERQEQGFMTDTTIRFVRDDGGRAAAGFKGSTGDCVVRAIAIAAEKPYQEVYDAVNQAAKSERRKKGRSSARNGVFRKTYEPYLLSLGFKWTPTMKIGSGCKVHLVADELPKGRLVVAVSKHLTAMIDGVIHDSNDPRRGPTYWYKPGTTEVDHISPDRCVYGYYAKKSQP